MLSKSSYYCYLSLFPPCLCWGVIFWSDAWGGQQCGGQLNEGEVRVGGLHIVLGQSGPIPQLLFLCFLPGGAGMSILHPWTPWHIGSGQVRVVEAVGEMEGGLLISLAPVWGFAGWQCPSPAGPAGWHSLCPTLAGSGDHSSHLLCQGSWEQHPSLAW